MNSLFLVRCIKLKHTILHNSKSGWIVGLQDWAQGHSLAWCVTQIKDQMMASDVGHIKSVYLHLFSVPSKSIIIWSILSWSATHRSWGDKHDKLGQSCIDDKNIWKTQKVQKKVPLPGQQVQVQECHWCVPQPLRHLWQRDYGDEFLHIRGWNSAITGKGTNQEHIPIFSICIYRQTCKTNSLGLDSCNIQMQYTFSQFNEIVNGTCNADTLLFTFLIAEFQNNSNSCNKISSNIVLPSTVQFLVVLGAGNGKSLTP